MECVSDLFTMRRECIESYGETIKQKYDERKRSFVCPVGGCGAECGFSRGAAKMYVD